MNQFKSEPTGFASIPLAVRHVSPITDTLEHDLTTRNGCHCNPRIETVPGGYIVIHNRDPLMVNDEARVIAWLESSSSARIERVMKAAESITLQRWADGVMAE